MLFFVKVLLYNLHLHFCQKQFHWFDVLLNFHEHIYVVFSFLTVCAFLNRNGGHIFLGISDNGKIVGVDEGYIKNMKKEFISLCNNPQKIEPTVYLNIREYEIEIFR